MDRCFLVDAIEKLIFFIAHKVAMIGNILELLLYL